MATNAPTRSWHWSRWLCIAGFWAMFAVIAPFIGFMIYVSGASPETAGFMPLLLIPAFPVVTAGAALCGFGLALGHRAGREQAVVYTLGWITVSVWALLILGFLSFL
ncbi:hypothetical protein [Cellulomonas sp. NPDC089187]|uniref:hypothetical protein n=1 Tax=Cellulomonas sp. NPDC089187 TaxID=3154970 RepID=UPI00341BE5DE